MASPARRKAAAQGRQPARAARLGGAAGNQTRSLPSPLRLLTYNRPPIRAHRWCTVINLMPRLPDAPLRSGTEPVEGFVLGAPAVFGAEAAPGIAHAELPARHTVEQQAPRRRRHAPAAAVVRR